jgi:hypothetical protein
VIILEGVSDLGLHVIGHHELLAAGVAVSFLGDDFSHLVNHDELLWVLQ